MNLRLSIDGVLLFFLLGPFVSDMAMFSPSNSPSTQMQGSSQVLGSAPMSDREKAGLRGPVRTCVEEITDPRGDRTTIATEYDADGRFLSSHSTYTDGSEWIKAQTYDELGRLARTGWGKKGEPGTESLYTYGESGRLSSITNYPHKGDRIDFEYDERGRKMSSQIFAPESLQKAQNMAYTGSPWDAAIRVGVGVPVGGKIVTTYDANGQPTELQIRDAEEQIVSRIVRTYDANGVLTEEKPSAQNPTRLLLHSIPDDQKSQLGPEQIEQLRQQMGILMAGKQQAGTVYEYDAQGRITKQRARNSFFEETTSTSYNDQGDKSGERKTYLDNSVIPVGVPHSFDENGRLVPSKPASEAPESTFAPQEQVTKYTYQYDDRGNWIEQTLSFDSAADVPAQVRRRKITYY